MLTVTLNYSCYHHYPCSNNSWNMFICLDIWRELHLNSKLQYIKMFSVKPGDTLAAVFRPASPSAILPIHFVTTFNCLLSLQSYNLWQTNEYMLVYSRDSALLSCYSVQPWMHTILFVNCTKLRKLPFYATYYRPEENVTYHNCMLSCQQHSW